MRGVFSPPRLTVLLAALLSTSCAAPKARTVVPGETITPAIVTASGALSEARADQLVDRRLAPAQDDEHVRELIDAFRAQADAPLVSGNRVTLLIDAMTDIASVRDAARTYLPWAAAYPLVAVWCFQLDGIYIGATRTAEMRNGAVIALAMLLGLGYALMPTFGNHGLWAAFLGFAAFRGLTLGYWYPRLLRSFDRPA